MAEADEWWKNAVIYGVDVERFCDSNGDGIGDSAGLTDKLDHIARLGVTCIWLLPFHPSTNCDNGYDITDYLQVDPRYGTFDDFLAFVTGAGARGIRVIPDLVAQHTSDRHPWFLSARRDARSPFRDYYVWTDHPPRPAPGKGPMFPPPGNGACNNFLRNLDEASLERLDPDAFRDTMDVLGPNDDMRIFGRGLRRRLAPMLGATGQGCAWPSACCLPCRARP